MQIQSSNPTDMARTPWSDANSHHSNWEEDHDCRDFNDDHIVMADMLR